MIRFTQQELDGASTSSAAYPGDFFVDLIFTDARTQMASRKLNVDLKEEERRVLGSSKGENNDDFWLNIS
jgi:hypothetical protein